MKERRSTVDREQLLRAAIFVTRIRDTSVRDHARRLRLAVLAQRILSEFIASEILAANGEAKNDPAHMSWQQIGDVVGLSRSAAFTKYGKPSGRN